MGLEEFIPPDAEIGSRHTVTGVIYAVDAFSVSIVLYTDPDKKLNIPKCMFACPDDDIESACEVRIHYWKEKDGKTKAIAEIVKEEKNIAQQLKRVIDLLKKVN